MTRITWARAAKANCYKELLHQAWLSQTEEGRRKNREIIDSRNCKDQGLSRKIKELVVFRDKVGILIATLQETKLSSTNSLSCSSSYKVLRKDRETNNGGGITFLVHSSVSFRPLDIGANSNDDHFGIQGFAVRSG